MSITSIAAPANVAGIAGGGSLLLRAYAYWDPREYSGSGPLLDLSKNGSLHPATLPGGSNDPLFLPWAGENYVYLPISNGNYISTPDHARLDITGDIDIRQKLALDDWSPSAHYMVMGKWDNVNERSYGIRVPSGAGGALLLRWTTDGTVGTELSAGSTAVVGFTDGTAHWIRITMDVDDGAGNRVIKFYTSEDYDPVTKTGTWTQLGTTVTAAGTTSIHAGTAILEMGSQASGTSQKAPGDYYTMQVFDGIDGTLVFDWDAQRSFTVDQENAAVVTINRTTSAAKSVEVTRPGFLHFTDDYFVVPFSAEIVQFTPTDSFTIVALKRVYGTPGNPDVTIAGSDTTASGWQFRQDLLKYRTIEDGNQTLISGDELVSGDFELLVWVRDGGTGVQTIYRNGVSVVSGSPTFRDLSAKTDDIGIMANNDGSAPTDGEFYGAAIFREALSSTDVLALNVEFGL